MSGKWLAWGALLFVGIALVAGRPRASADPPRGAGGSKTAIAASVLLFANLGEAKEPCHCGEIIRAVRAAAARGVKTREVDARNKDEKAKVAQQYRIMVVPAVLLLDDAGKEVRRFEGESQEMLDGVKAALDKMAKK